MQRGRPRKDKSVELAEMIAESAEIDNQDVEIVPVEQVEIMSMAQLEDEKQKLAARRQAVMLRLDGRRLEQSVKIMDAMDVALSNMINNFTFDEEGNSKALSAMDFKFYSDAYKNLSQTLNTVSRLDSVDSGGRAGRVELRLETPDGTLHGKVEW